MSQSNVSYWGMQPDHGAHPRLWGAFLGALIALALTGVGLVLDYVVASGANPVTPAIASVLAIGIVPATIAGAVFGCRVESLEPDRPWEPALLMGVLTQMLGGMLVGVVLFSAVPGQDLGPYGTILARLGIGLIGSVTIGLPMLGVIWPMAMLWQTLLGYALHSQLAGQQVSITTHPAPWSMAPRKH